MRSSPRSLLACLPWASILLVAGACVAQGQAPKERLTLERLHATTDFTAQGFGPARWLEDGSGFTTLEPSAGTAGGRDIVRHDPETGAREVLVSAERLVPPRKKAPLEIADYAWSSDGRRVLVFTNTRKVWRLNTRGDYWVLDLDTWQLRRLGADFEPASLMFAAFSPDGGRVAYVHANDLYVEHLADGRRVRLTSDGSQTVINGTFDWVYEEELGLHDGFRWSPDGRHIAYWQLDSEGVGVFHLIDNLAGPYPRLVPIRYPKAGTTNSACRVGVVPAEGGETRWLALEGDPRQHYVARMEWAAGSDELVLQRLNRLQDRLEVLLGDAATGAVRSVLVETDAAWVDVVDDLRWLDGGRRFTWVSERDGWRHVYLVSRDGRDVRCVTPGAYDVVSVEGVDEAGGWLWLIASPEDPKRRFLHRVRLDGSGGLQRVTPPGKAGTHAYQLSPDCRWALRTWSGFEHPPVVDLVRLPGHESRRVLVANAALLARYEALERTPVEFFRVTVERGVELDGWCIKPPGFDPTRRWPVLFHVYGEPWGQTVVDRWGGGNHLWHRLLAQRGWVVMSVDNRGTPAPRGREWRKCIYGQVGVLASEDQAAAVRAIGERWSWVDRERIGYWGWSGGGSMTLNMLLRYPELVSMGISVAPVPNQRYYDTIYQERYMGLPEGNRVGYEQGSPVTFARQLEGDLLIVHGTGDDNVHYQGTEELIDRLVAANKPFTMMAYPGRSHSIREGEGTRRHLFELMTRFLEQHLPPGPRARSGWTR